MRGGVEERELLRGRVEPGVGAVDPIDLVRMCATARILMPRSRVRLSAGRTSLSNEAQLLCFMGKHALA